MFKDFLNLNLKVLQGGTPNPICTGALPQLDISVTSKRHLAILGPWWGHLHSHKEGLEVRPEDKSPEVSL